MARSVSRIFDRLLDPRDQTYWDDLTKNFATVDLSKLRAERSAARVLKESINNFLEEADNQFALPKIGNQAFPKQAGTDWSWRPAVWSGKMDRPGISSVENGTRLNSEVALYHDCGQKQITLRQVRNQRESDLAAFGLKLNVFSFGGSYLSLVVELPSSAMQDIQKAHIFKIDTILEMERPLEIFARFNIQHGPNVEQVVQELPVMSEDINAEFDLHYTGIKEKRVTRAWLDLIFEGPELNEVVIRDLAFSRRLRSVF